MSELVENDTPLPILDNFDFGGNFWAKKVKNRTRGSSKNRKLPTDFADF